MQISNFVISLVIVSAILGGLGLLLGNLVSEYGTPNSYNESDVAIYNQMNRLNVTTQQLKPGVLEGESEARTGIESLDLVGGFLANAVASLKIAAESLETFKVMIYAGTTRVGIPPIFVTMTIVIVTLAFIFAIVSAMVKKDV